MKTLFLATVAMIGFVVLADAAEHKGASTKGLGILESDALDESAVKKIWGGFTDAWNRHDTKTMASFFTHDGDHVEPDGTVAKGRAQVEALFQKEHATVFKKTKLDLTVKSVWMVTEDVALADGVYKLAGATDPKGNPIPEREGRLTSILLREDGQWWVAASRLMIPIPLVWKEK